MPRRLLAAVVVLALACAAGCGDDGSDEAAPLADVDLALDFTPNAVHAPLFAAVRTRRDRAHGVRLRIRPPGNGPDGLRLVASGRVDLGVLDIHDLAIARAGGVDVVAVGALVRSPLAALVARRSVARPRDLEGRRVGVSGLPSDPAFVAAIVGADGGDPDRVRRITIGFESVQALVAGRVDAAPVFWNAEGVALRERGVDVREFRVEDYGAPAYPEVVLVTARKTLERRREAVRCALLAIRDGVGAVEDDPAAAVDEVAREARSTGKDLVAAQLRAVRPVFARGLRLDRAVLARWAAFDARIGIVDAPPDVGRAFAFGLLDRQ